MGQLQSIDAAVKAPLQLETARLLLMRPQLEGRFGEAYLEYCRHVPRIVPRLRPWVQNP